MSSAQSNLNPKQQREKQRAQALAALTQAVSLVESIAQKGECDASQFAMCMDFLFNSTEYKHTFYTGSIKAKRLLQAQEVSYAKPMLLHITNLLALEKKLSKQTDRLQAIAEGMRRIDKQVQYFNDPYHGNIIAAVASLYGETISDLTPRIIVRGKPEHLKQMPHTEKIRCLLFSAIRAAWLWRSNGGNALLFVFGRKKLIQALSQLGKKHE